MNVPRPALAITLALAATPALGAKPPELTIYSGDYGAVLQSGGHASGIGLARYRAPLSWTLAAGDNAVRVDGLPAAIDVGSVRLEPQSEARVRGQRYDFARAGQQELLQRAIGQTVVVDYAAGATRESVTGTLLAAGDGLTLRLPDGRIRVVSQYAGFELASLPADLAVQPGLAWTVAAARAGRQDFVLAYDTGGLAWRAEYQADVGGQGTRCRMRLDGAALVANGSGSDFRGVSLSLVAGQPNRVADAGPMVAKQERAMVLADAAPAPETSGEYHAYRLPGVGDLPQGSVQRLPLLDPVQGVPCQRGYEVASAMGGWRPPHPLLDGGLGADREQRPVIATLAFDNARAHGLGLPLPAGRLRVLEGGELLGEAALGHTAAGSPVALALGTAFDLRAERTREDFRVDRDGRTMQETFSIRVDNAKAEAVTVSLRETLPRWTDWEIVESGQPARKLGAQEAGFTLQVPAGGQAQLRYTVRYRWAPDVRIP